MYLKLNNWDTGEVHRAFLQFSTEYNKYRLDIPVLTVDKKKPIKVDYEYYIEICCCLLDEFRTIHQRHQLIQNQD